jgi:hypothetical protein
MQLRHLLALAAQKPLQGSEFPRTGHSVTLELAESKPHFRCGLPQQSRRAHNNLFAMPRRSVFENSPTSARNYEFGELNLLSQRCLLGSSNIAGKQPFFDSWQRVGQTLTK